MPLLHNTTMNSWFKKNRLSNFGVEKVAPSKKKVYFFNVEFTNYKDVKEGQLAIRLLTKLGYEVIIPKHVDSGRPYLSKGLLKEAKIRAEKNINLLAPIISDSTPLIGLEPSAILTFRDEYIDLLRGELKEKAKKIAANTFTIDEFLANEFERGNISSELFTDEKRLIKLHGHCHQKALSSVIPTKKILSIPQGYSVEMIPSGCCGMAGSFGYEKEHYELSMQVGELVLFPTVRSQDEDVLIAAPGTSCRHQIKDGTGRLAQHPVEILWNALK
jgi:Fe-S oxidoreductase